MSTGEVDIENEYYKAKGVQCSGLACFRFAQGWHGLVYGQRHFARNDISA
jgi:hypothetical protein